MVLPTPIFQLQCETNEYEWGKKGSHSKAAQFAFATKESAFKIDDAKPYAELWMGTHSSGPSKVLPGGILLSEVLDDNQALCGKEISDTYEGRLPFLFKVLSIDKALSIQCHPTKELARKLHKDDPKNYKDDNHKPEMAIAITPFEGFCGFRPIEEISSFLDEVPSFSDLLGDQATASFKRSTDGKTNSKTDSDVKGNRAALRDLFTVLMQKSDSDIRRAAEDLIKSAKSSPASFAGRDFGGEVLSELVIRLNSQFPSDVGLFCTFFLNYVTMKPGEALFLKALDCHAYLSGDIMECMAASDNVVRAGFTPKFKDVKNLTEMLTYAYAPPQEQKMSPEEWSKGSGEGRSILYDPPIDEFSVVQTTIKASEKELHKAVKGPSIIICTTGSGKYTVGNKSHDVVEGQVYFIGADAELEVEASKDGSMVTYRAFAEVEAKTSKM